MALVWDGTSTDRATTSSVGSLSIDTSCAFSACGWLTSSSLNASKSAFGLSFSTTTQFVILRRAAAAAINAFGAGVGPYFTNVTIPEDGTWFFWGVSISGSAIGNATFYVWTPADGWSSSTNSIALQTIAAPDALGLGNSPRGGTAEAWATKQGATKVWNAVLTEDEIKREMMSLSPVRLDGLHAALPMIGLASSPALRDLRGNTWTLSGTITFDDTHPGVPYGPPLDIPNEVVVTYSFARPITDITTGWTTSTGSSHFALIDEETASDADYIYATAASQTDEVKLAALTAPTGDIQINYRVQGIAASGRVTVSMYAGATLVKSDTQRTANGDYTMTVTSTDYASVTDWSDIRLRFVSG